MSLTTYKPRPRRGFQFQESSRSYDDAECTCPQTVFIESCTYAPHIDISEDETNLYILAELPGLDVSDVHISLADDILTIRGKKERVDNGRAYHRTERSFGEFVRQFALASMYDQTAITSKFSRGILEVVIPKYRSYNEKNLSPTQHDPGTSGIITISSE